MNEPTIIEHMHFMHGKRGCFVITRYSNGFELWRQTHKPSALPDPLAWMLATGQVTKAA